MAPLVVLGATGSIGRQTLEVARKLGFPIRGLAARRPSSSLAKIAAQHPEAEVVVVGGDESAQREWAASVPNRVGFGAEGVVDLAGRSGQIVVNGIVGAAGLRASLAALEAGNRLALANKESMVAAGDLVNRAVRSGGGEVIPVDSEHSALFQCLLGEHPDDVARLILTASGGPFRGRSADELADVTPAEALDHPTWSMGGRITVDSATLMNKGLEVIEAHHLFGVPFDRVEVVVHPRSIVHSLIEFVDGALKGHVGHPDMRVPIQYALTFPRRGPNPGERFTLPGQVLEFEEVDRTTFPALDLAYEAGRRGGIAPAVLNAADEVAVAAFLEGRLPFPGIIEVVSRTLEEIGPGEADTVEAVLQADTEARQVAGSLASAIPRG